MFQPFITKAKKALKVVGKLLNKVICVFDDIPFLLQIKDTGNVGPLLLVGAGFLIFPLQVYEGIKGIKKAQRPQHTTAERRAMMASNGVKLAFAIFGFIATAALLAFVLTNLAVFAAAASIAIPAVMAAISGVELIYDVYGLYKTAKSGSDTKDAKRDVAYSSAFFGFGLAITALATLSVLTGLGVLSFGIVPAAILVGVVVIALAVKVFQIIDHRKDAEGVRHYPLTNGLKRLFGVPVPMPTPPQQNLHAVLGVSDMSEVRAAHASVPFVETGSPSLRAQRSNPVSNIVVELGDIEKDALKLFGL